MYVPLILLLLNNNIVSEYHDEVIALLKSHGVKHTDYGTHISVDSNQTLDVSVMHDLVDYQIKGIAASIDQYGDSILIIYP
jgi:hypothetical protein